MISSEWKEYKLSELVEIVGGGTPKTSVKEYWNGDIPWLSVKDFNNVTRKVYTTEKSITRKGLENSSTKLLNKGDLIISARGTVGALAQLGRPMAFNQSCYGLKAKDITSNDFMFYLLKYKIDELKNNTHGSVFDTITRKTFDLIYAKIPPKYEQDLIVKVLSSLDEKIEINNRINEKLETIAQTIFKCWFIDFEFPNENGEPYKSSGGKMIESELGNIPEGWSVQKLNNICEVTIGGDWGKESKEKDLVPAICLRGVDLQHIKENGFAGDAPVRWVKLNSVKKRTVSDNDILLGGSGAGPVGRSLYVHNSITNLYQYPIIYSNFCKRISAENKYVAYYVSEILHRMYITKEMNSFVTGTSVPNLDINSLMNVKIIVPKTKLLKIFYENIVDPMLRWKYSNENLILANIRDTLLPKLISGEIRVPVENE